MKYLLIFALLLGVLLVVPAGAAEYYDGYVTSGGWTYHSGDGYWWKNGQAYSRTLVTQPGYWYCGYYYQGSSYWQYSAASYSPPTKKTIAYTRDWKSKVLEVAKQRDDHNAYLQALKTLGMPLPPDQGPVSGGGYGYRSASSALYSLAGTGTSFQLGTYGANATTLYGYQAARDPYGSTDLNALYQQAARLTQNAQQLGGQAHTDFSDLVKSAGNNQARVAEILAQAAAAEKVLSAAKGPGVTTQEARTFQFQANPAAPPAPAPAQTPAPPAPVGPLVPAPGAAPIMPRADAPRAALSVLMQQKCASCHSGKKLEGGFDVTKYSSLAPADKLHVVGLLTTTDASKRMPKGKPALAAEEIRLFLAN